MKIVKVTVTIPDVESFQKVLTAARAAGFTVDGSFPKLGVATGSIALDRVQVLRGLSGLSSVEEQKTYRAV